MFISIGIAIFLAQRGRRRMRQARANKHPLHNSQSTTIEEWAKQYI